MALYEAWKKEAEAVLKKAKPLFPSCPKCNAHDFDFDPITGRLKCKKCGFEVYLKMA